MSREYITDPIEPEPVSGTTMAPLTDDTVAMDVARQRGVAFVLTALKFTRILGI